MSIDEDQVRARTFTPFFTAGRGPCKFALRTSEGNLYVVQKVLKVVGGSCPAMVAGKHCFLVYLENNEFCFIEAGRLPSAEWYMTAQSTSFSLEKFASQIAVCSHLRWEFEIWWKDRIGLTFADLDMIRRCASDPV